jgi:chemotaxis protein CheD
LTMGQAVKNEVMVVVGLGEIQVSNDPNYVLSCLGLGSCIGISAYDPVAHVGAVVHVVLPHCSDPESEKAPAKYANTALPFMLHEMEKLGAIKKRIIIKLVGGAKIISTIPAKSILDIGERNCEAIKIALTEHKFDVKAENLKGTLGRSMWLNIETGITRFRTTASPIVEL